MKITRIQTIFALAFAASAAHAQFAGNAFFSIAPTTNAPGSVVNSLTVSNTVSGLVVTGTWSVNMPANTSNGFLLTFQCKRLLQTGVFPSWTTTTAIPGTDFINRPVGNGSTFGAASTSVDNGPGSTSAWSFPNPAGSGTLFYNGGFGYTNTSGVFNYGGGSGNYLVLDYFVDLNYSGPGGFYAFTFPLSADINVVPEPCTVLALVGGAVTLVRRRRK